MRIIITENQYRTILKENKIENFLTDYINKNKTTQLDDVFRELYNQYGFTVDTIFRFDVLKQYFSDRLGEKFNFNTAYGKLRFLKKITDLFGYKIDKIIKKHIIDVTQGLLDDVLDEVATMSKGDIRKYSKLVTDVQNFLPKTEITGKFRELVANKGNEMGYVMINKPLSWTFEKGGGRVQQIIDYIKDIPETPKKTRKGWMEYVGIDTERDGWNSYLWRAVQDAGIIEKVRDGRNFIYKLGPNAEAFEQGKLIGF